MIGTIRFLRNHRITSRNLSAGLLRYVRWQVGSWILGHPIVVPFVDDAVLVVEKGMTGATGNIYAGLHNVSEMSLLMHFLRPEDTFVDIGANVGSYTVLASKVVGAQSFAFEPVPTTFRHLTRNVLVNGISDRVVVRQTAVGSRNAFLKFSADRDTENGPVNDDYVGETIVVPTERLDDLVGHCTPTMLKIDVEGHEAEVIAGASATLAAAKLAIVVLEGNSAECENTLKGSGFVEVEYDPFARSVHLVHNPITKFCNHIWVRDYEAVEKRCRTSRSFKVLNIDV